ncbi:hypothetical protein F4V91_08720 [Neorhizobium galegae]|uniref:Tail fiber protein n=1 Tax=Neorhizobium galegae TaxID=399 RepID=A0A6A1TPC9_NEOGA|nr:hypothetical protein [Neorhizobium galegae]KAB1086502.1 hypothetical protein F4V91_08720 [Neorhizobium galegae]
MAVTSKQVGIGAAVAGLSAIVALVTAIVTLYSQVSDVITSSVFDRLRKDFAPIGTVVSSVLTPEEFAKSIDENVGWQIKDRTWVLADGRAVEGTKFAIDTNGRTIPDLRGLFLRGIDTGGGRQAGSIEDFATALPRSSPFTGTTELTGAHTHAGGAALGGGDQFEAGGDDYRVLSVTTTQAAGGHSHALAITGGGDGETRPRNAAVYYFIKIN